jgi:hypothetical protein
LVGAELFMKNPDGLVGWDVLQAKWCTRMHLHRCFSADAFHTSGNERVGSQLGSVSQGSSCWQLWDQIGGCIRIVYRLLRAQ